MFQLLSLRRTSTEEPRLDDVAKLGTGALPFEQLLGVVPTHPPPWQAAANQNYLALFVSSSRYHDDAARCLSDEMRNGTKDEWMVVAWATSFPSGFALGCHRRF
jgi:hypothetical protein